MDQAEVSLQTNWNALQRIKVDKIILTIHTGLTIIQGSLSSLDEQVSKLEHRVSSDGDNIDDLTKCLQTREKENAYLKDNVDDAEFFF